MARQRGLCQDSKGRFVRNLGWKQTPRGYGQQKFYLGRDEAKAKIASLRLEQLWLAVSRRWERQTLQIPRIKPGQSCQKRIPLSLSSGAESSTLFPTVDVLFTVGLPEVEFAREGKPVWDKVTLAIAESIRNGDAIARVPLPDKLGARGLADPSVGQWLNTLREDVQVIHIELLDSDAQEQAERELDERAEQLVKQAKRMRRRGAGGETLPAALRAYSGWIDTQYAGLDGRLDAWGVVQKRQVDFLARHLPNCALVELTAHRIDEFFDVLRRRPLRENGNRITVDSARNLIKQFRSFLRWLNKSPEFSWKRPPDYETTPIRIVQASDERASRNRSSQVDTYTPEELRTLFEYASPLQRVFMLLALNCGFGRAELASLDISDVHLHQKHPDQREIGCPTTESDSWIFYTRQKTAVPGQWKLWTETVSAIDWWLWRRGEILVSPAITTLLINGRGNRYDAPTKGNHPNYQIPNGWFHLTKRIQKNHASFRSLSFNKLRKTAGNLIRQNAGGEVAGVFLCHGKPVASDNQLEGYTNRPFARVFEACDTVGELLRPVWAAVSNPFPEMR